MQINIFNSFNFQKDDILGIRLKDNCKEIISFTNVFKEENPTRYYLIGVNHRTLVPEKYRIIHIQEVVKIVESKVKDTKKKNIEIEEEVSEETSQVSSNVIQVTNNPVQITIDPSYYPNNYVGIDSSSVIQTATNNLNTIFGAMNGINNDDVF
jgi:hypothetical protein